MRPTRIAFLPLLLLAACLDSSGPGDDVVGPYRMVEYNGTTLPAAIPYAPNCQQNIFTGTLQLGGDKSFTATITLQNSCASDSTPAPYITVTQRGHYRTVGRSLHIQVDGEPTEQPLAAADGSIVDLDLRPYFGAPTRYVRGILPQ